jgi:alkylated DNA nucleotide flippase Atl1
MKREQRLTDAQREVVERIRTIPPGFVRTYGDVSPGAPRLAGQVLSRLDDAAVPWFRVVRADGSLAKGARQRRLLQAEGVPFAGERVILADARLDPLDAA